MNWYTLALFAHIVGVLLLFLGMGLQWLITLRLRAARTAAQAREWSSLVSGVGRLAPLSGVLILAAGLYMAVTAWSLMAPWVLVSLGAMLLMLALGMGVVARRLKAIQRSVATDDTSGALSRDAQARITDPFLWVALHLSGGVALGIVFLMTTKPTLWESLLTLVVALALGGVAGGMSAKPHRNPRAATASAGEASHV